MGIKVVVTNRKAFHDYTIEDKLEAGLVLTGTEVKSIRNGKMNLSDGWVEIRNGEAYLRDAQISPYSHGNLHNHFEKRARKLLLNRKELIKIESRISEKGLSCIPLQVYFKDRFIKVEIGIARGKKKYDKREAEKTKTANRDIARAMR